MNKLISVVSALAVSVLAGCSGGSGGDGQNLVAIAANVFSDRIERARSARTEPFSIERTFGPEEIEAMSGPTLAGHLLARDVWSGMTLAFSSGGYDHYHTADGIGLVFRSDVMVSTRGINGDLFASDMSGTLRALAGRNSGRYQKSMRFLTPLSGFTDASLTCELRRGEVESFVIARQTYSARRYTENCILGDTTIENHFFRDASGAILRSRQWIGPEGGYIDLYRLKR